MPTTTATAPTGPSSEPAAGPPHAPFTGRWLETGPDLGHLFVDQRSLIWDGEAFYQMLRVGFGDVRVWRSIDAIEWEEMPQLGMASTIDGPQTLISSPRGLTAIGDEAGMLFVWIFEGETPWRKVPLADLGGTVQAAIYFNDVYVAMGWVPELGGEGGENGIPFPRHGVVWASHDLEDWEQVAGAELFGEDSITTGLSLGGDGLVVTFKQSPPDLPGGYGGPTLRATSADGIIWRLLGEDPASDRIQLRPDADAALAWKVHPEDASPFPRPERAGNGYHFAEWKEVPVVSGIVFSITDDRTRGPGYPAVWSLASGDTWIEVGPFSRTLTEPGQIGEIVPAGDRLAAFGWLWDEGEEQKSVVFTFVLEFPVEHVMYDWVNQTGLGQVDPAVWTERLDRACREGVWDDDVARSLADEFIADDMPYSLRDDGSTPDTDGAAQALWLMAVNYCRANFPAGEIQDGPIGR